MMRAKARPRESRTAMYRNLPHRRPRLLLALYESKGLKIARAGAPSPLSTLSGRQNNS